MPANTAQPPTVRNSQIGQTFTDLPKPGLWRLVCKRAVDTQQGTLHFVNEQTDTKYKLTLALDTQLRLANPEDIPDRTSTQSEREQAADLAYTRIANRRPS